MLFFVTYPPFCIDDIVPTVDSPLVLLKIIIGKLKIKCKLHQTEQGPDSFAWKLEFIPRINCMP